MSIILRRVEQESAKFGLKPESFEPGAMARGLFPLFQTASVFQGAPVPHYLDTAATSQKPRMVIERLQTYLSTECANVHRGAYGLSERTTDNFEGARACVAKFLNAPSPNSIVFTKGTTESINLVASALEDYFHTGDVLMVTELEHHSNLVPWQLLAQRKKLELCALPIAADASLSLDVIRVELMRRKPKLLALTYVSNAFGTIVPAAEIVSIAKEAGCLVLLDAAQAAAHRPIDVAALGVDFLVFSGHKTYGPTGIGVLYVREALYELMKPYQGGGGMIQDVAIEASTWADPPHKFEAGTPPIAEAIALQTALEFIGAVGWQRILAHDEKLSAAAAGKLRAESAVTLYGPVANGGASGAIVAFNLDGVHPHDLASVADTFNVQIRAGHHCALPALRKLGLQSTARASFGVYSTEDDIDALVTAIRHARKLFG